MDGGIRFHFGGDQRSRRGCGLPVVRRLVQAPAVVPLTLHSGPAGCRPPAAFFLRGALHFVRTYKPLHLVPMEEEKFKVAATAYD